MQRGSVAILLVVAICCAAFPDNLSVSAQHSAAGVVTPPASDHTIANRVLSADSSAARQLSLQANPNVGNLPANVVQMTAIVDFGTPLGPCTAKAMCLGLTDDVQKCANLTNLPEQRWSNVVALPTGDVIDVVFQSDADAFESTLAAFCYGIPYNCSISSVVFGPLTPGGVLHAQQAAQNVPGLQLSPVAFAPEMGFLRQLFPDIMQFSTGADSEGEKFALLCKHFNWADVAVIAPKVHMPVGKIGFMEAAGLPPKLVPTAVLDYRSIDDFRSVIEQIAIGPARIVVMFLKDHDFMSPEQVIQILEDNHMLGYSGTAAGHNWGLTVNSEWMLKLQGAPAALRKRADGLLSFLTYQVNSTDPKFQAFQQQWDNVTALSGGVCPDLQPSTAHVRDTARYYRQALGAELTKLRQDPAHAGASATSLASDVEATMPGLLRYGWETPVEGLTGRVVVDQAIGTRRGPWRIVNMQNGQLVEVGLVREQYTTADVLPTSEFLLGPQYGWAKVLWPNGMQAPPSGTNANSQEYHTSPTLMKVLFAYSVINIIIAVVFIVLIIVLRKEKVINWSSPIFCIFILLGPAFNAIIDVYIVVVEAGSFLAPPKSGCMMFFWSKMLAFTMTFSGVFARTYRINKIFMNRHKMKRVAVKDRQLWGIIAAIFALFCTFYTLWSIISPELPENAESTWQITDHDSHTSVITMHFQRCASTSVAGEVFRDGAVIMIVALLVWGAVLAIQTRSVPAGFNESRYLGYAIFNGLLVYVLFTTVIRLTATDTPNIFLTLTTFADSQPLLLTMLVLFVPKFYAVYHNKHVSLLVTAGNHSTSSLTSGRGSYVSTGSSKGGHAKKKIAMVNTARYSESSEGDATDAAALLREAKATSPTSSVVARTNPVATESV